MEWLEAELPPQDDNASAVASHRCISKVSARKPQIGNAQIRMVERIIKLTAQDEVITFPKLDGLLRGEVPKLKAWRRDSIAAQVSVLTQDYVVMEVVLGRGKVSRYWIETKRRVEIRKSNSVDAKAYTRITRTIGVQACRTVVYGNLGIPQ